MCFLEACKRHEATARITVQAKRIARQQAQGRLPVANCKLQIADCQLQIASCQLPVASCQAAHSLAAQLTRADVKASRAFVESRLFSRDDEDLVRVLLASRLLRLRPCSASPSRKVIWLPIRRDHHALKTQAP